MPDQPETRAGTAAGPSPAQLLAATLLVYTEDHAAFEQLYAEFEDFVQPTNFVEAGILRDLVANRWRLDRIRAVEACLLRDAVDEYRPRRTRPGPPPPPIPCIAPATADLLRPSNSVLARLSRHETQLQQRLGMALRQLKSARTLPRPARSGPEPTNHLEPKRGTAPPASPVSAPSPAGPAAGGTAPVSCTPAAKSTTPRAAASVASGWLRNHSARQAGAADGWRRNRGQPRPSAPLRRAILLCRRSTEWYSRPSTQST